MKQGRLFINPKKRTMINNIYYRDWEGSAIDPPYPYSIHNLSHILDKFSDEFNIIGGVLNVQLDKNDEYRLSLECTNEDLRDQMYHELSLHFLPYNPRT